MKKSGITFLILLAAALWLFACAHAMRAEDPERKKAATIAACKQYAELHQVHGKMSVNSSGLCLIGLQRYRCPTDALDAFFFNCKPEAFKK